MFMKQGYRVNRRITSSYLKRIIAGTIGADDDCEPFIVMKSKTTVPLMDRVGWDWYLVANPLHSTKKRGPVCAYHLASDNAKRIIKNFSMNCVSSNGDGFIYERDGSPFFEKYKGKGNQVADFY